MRNKLSYALLLLFVMIAQSSIANHPLQAQSDIYSFPKIEETPIEKPKQNKKKDPFVQLFSQKMNIPEGTVSDAFSRGFGRSELIRLILISKKSKKETDALLAEREKGASLKKMAKEAGLNHKLLRKETLEILKDLELEEEKIKSQQSKSETATAGVSEDNKK